MTPYPILFNQTPASLRRIGAQGGRARAHNWRLRQRTASIRPSVNPVEPSPGTTAQAIARLNAQFPWLRDAESRARR